MPLKIWITGLLCCGCLTYTETQKQLTWFFWPPYWILALKYEHNLAQLWGKGCSRSFQDTSWWQKWVLHESVMAYRPLSAFGTFFWFCFLSFAIHFAYKNVFQFENLTEKIRLQEQVLKWHLHFFWALRFWKTFPVWTQQIQADSTNFYTNT